MKIKTISWGLAWHRFSSNKASVVGLALTVVIIFIAIFAPYIVPYPEHGGAFVDFASKMQGPSLSHLCGTDNVGRDIFSRILLAFRSALLMGVMVLAISVPAGFLLGVIAGYFRGTIIDSIIMRVTDIFLSIPPLILALAVASILQPSLTNSMLAITVLWWPWYTRLAYGIASSLRTENYIVYAELTGGNVFHILVKEILPNCVGPVLTKMALDICWVIMMGATLSFVGLGEQAPKPALGNMVSDGIKYLPESWWITVFPALAIILIVFSLNLVGDGISDIFAEEANA